MSDHSQAHGVIVESFRRLPPPTVLASGEFGGRAFAVGTAEKDITNSLSKSSAELLVRLCEARVIRRLRQKSSWAILPQMSMRIEKE